MASPEVLDFAKLLAPIPGDKPAGIDLRADPSPTSAYYAIKDARSAARAAERQLISEGDETAPPSDWKPVILHGTKALAEKSKDLEVTAYLIEALVRQHSFAGLRDGFRLARELVDKFWDGIYPMPDEEGMETRVAPLTGLNGDDAEGTLIAPINKIPITDSGSYGRLTWANYQEGLATNKIADPKAREKKIAAGAMNLELFQKAVSETPPKWYANLVQDMTQCNEEFTKLCAALDKRCGNKAPPSSAIRASLTAVMDVVKDVARAKLEVAAPPPEAGKDGAAPDGAPNTSGTAGTGPPAPPDALRTREDAFRQLLKVADYFRKCEPHNPASYALEQVVRWAQMPLPELLTELIPDEAPRKNLFKQVGIKPPEPPGKEAGKK